MPHIFKALTNMVCQHLNIWCKHCGHLIFCDAADGGELRIHGDVRQVVDGGEDAQLRELRDTRDKAETNHRLTRLQGLVELLHHFAELGEVLFLVKHLEQRGVVLIDDQHYLPARLLVGTTNQTLE